MIFEAHILFGYTVKHYITCQVLFSKQCLCSHVFFWSSLFLCTVKQSLSAPSERSDNATHVSLCFAENSLF